MGNGRRLRKILAVGVLCTIVATGALTTQASAATEHTPAFTGDIGPRFADVPSSNAFYADINWLFDEGYASGTPQPTGLPLFAPRGSLTRQALAAFLYRFAGSPDVFPGEPEFADVPADHPFFTEIQWMAQEGISTGTPQGEGKPLFKPGDPVTREAVAAFLWRQAGEPDPGVLSPAAGAGSEPNDVPEAHVFHDAVLWLYRVWVTKGNHVPGGNEFRGSLTITREAFAAMLHRLSRLTPSEDCVGSTTITSVECDALFAIWSANNWEVGIPGSNPDGEAGFDGGPEPCLWFGVTCTDGHVTGLKLWGTAVPADIAGLPYLETLEIRGASGQPTLPPELGSFAALEVLTINGGSLTGVIPASIGNLYSLTELTFYGTSIAGPLPASIGQLGALETLGLNTNSSMWGPMPDLDGLISLQNLHVVDNSAYLPFDFSGPPNLRYLTWENSPVQDQIPDVFTTMPKLTHVYIRNRIAGPIPASLSTLTELESLDLGGNKLTGSIPESLGNLTSLKELQLGFNELTGTIPASLGNLHALEHLGLYNNHLTGSIPVSVAELPALMSVAVSDNDLTGTIPSALGNGTELRTLDLNGNDLTGSIPSSFGGLSKVVQINLSDNQLTGAIPSAIGSLPELVTFDLGHNQLSGPVPISLMTAPKLSTLRLSPNGCLTAATSEFWTWLFTKDEGWNSGC